MTEGCFIEEVFSVFRKEGDLNLPEEISGRLLYQVDI